LSWFFSRRGFFRKFKTRFSKLGYQADLGLVSVKTDRQNRRLEQTVSGKTKATRVLGGWFVVNSVGWALKSKTKATWSCRWLKFKELFGPDFGAIETTAA
jgi:hypothetical protein